MTKEEKKDMVKDTYTEVVRLLVVLEALCTSEPECAEDEQILRKAVRALRALK